MSPPRRSPHRHDARLGFAWALLFAFLMWALIAFAVIRLVL